MEQQGNQNQRRLPPPAVQPENQQLQQQPPQKCPRCDSINTKFCYYNNYSLTQPRHFCKNCRRYWTHGGTLRNVPVGGGCRKGKRAKTTTAAGDGQNSRSQPPPPPTPQQSEQQNQQNLITPATAALPPQIIPANSYFSSGGFLSSLVNIQSLSQTQPNQEQINVGDGGGQFGNASTFSLLQGMNFTSFRSQAQDQQIQNPNEFYQMGNRDQNIELPIYPSDQGLVHPNRPTGSWNQNPLINNTNPIQWPDLPGYGPPT